MKKKVETPHLIGKKRGEKKDIDTLCVVKEDFSVNMTLTRIT